MGSSGITPPKLDSLLQILKQMESAVIAFSGGLDSTFLLKAVALSGIRAKAVIGYSPTMPEHDFQDAREMAFCFGVPHLIIKTEELEKDEFRKNPPDRCFHCKDELFGKLKRIAESEGYQHVADGSTVDDLNDWRPGRRAALHHGVRSPLIEAGMTKEEVRELSRMLNLPTWNKPSSPCLSSRFPYGETITDAALRQVQEAEKLMRSLGFTEFRVRHHGETARIEVTEEEMPKMLDPEIRRAVTEELRSLGYAFVALDLEGFKSGKLNRTIPR